MDTRLRWTGWFGLAAAVVYIGATAAGSLLDPEYSQIRQHVSDLTASGATTWAALAPAYLAYNLGVIGLQHRHDSGVAWRIQDA